MRTCLLILCGLLGCLASSAQQSLRLRGLKAPVEVLRDSFGVNHIYAANTHDLFFAQGYCAARDRLFQFEVWRRQATGTVAELLGPAEVKRDLGARLFRYRGNLRQELQRYHPEGTAIIGAFVSGVNARIAEVLRDTSELPFEFRLLGLQPGFWTPEVVISRHGGVLSNALEELSTARAVARIGPEAVRAIEQYGPLQPDLRLDPSITPAMLEGDLLGPYAAMRRPLLFPPLQSTAAHYRSSIAEKERDGSNNWVVSGARTASGFPVLANDPHRAVALPSLRYLVHLSAPGWNVAGGGEPVIPGVSIGHNDSGAWGLTIFETDAEDILVYDLNPENLAQYRYRNRWMPMRELADTIPVRGGRPVAVALRYTLHGPVTFIDTARRKAYAVRCGWLEAGGAPYLASLRYNQCRNWKEFREASRYNHMPGENMVWADRAGNIGWQVVGINPLRTEYSGMVPVPGDGRFDWSGYQDGLERPYLFNPPEGFWATANEEVTPKEYPFPGTLAFSWADAYRGNRIRSVLRGDTAHSAERAAALQGDYHSLPSRTLVPLLAGLKGMKAEVEEGRALLLAWDGNLAPGSGAAALYALWERRLLAAAAERYVPAAVRGGIGLPLSRVVSWMAAPNGPPGPARERERDSFLKETLTEAVAELISAQGRDPKGWAYGRWKEAVLTHPLSGWLPAEQRAQVNLGPVPRGGNSHTPNATGGTARQGHGATFRMVCDLSDWDRTRFINSPGQSGDPRSPYYSNLFPLWAENGYFPGYFSRPQVQAATRETLRLLPGR